MGGRSKQKVACIGLGQIAIKAYLPILSARADIDLHLVTRDRSTLDRLGEQYRLHHRHQDLASALTAGFDAAFVSSATQAHAEQVQVLLAAGVDVYVDKPLARDLHTCEQLVQLAEASDRLLMVGFNRRYAPAYASLQARPRDLILMEKNRRCLPGPPREVIFDDFVHVVDTLLSLVPGAPLRTSHQAKVVDGELHHVVLQISGEGFTALGLMNRMSGSDEESLEVSGGGEKCRVENMTHIINYGPVQEITRRGDWTTTTWDRGLDQICDHFLTESRMRERIPLADSLQTHRICENIAARIENGAV